MSGLIPLLIGTYTDGTSEGIYAYRFNQETGIVDSSQIGVAKMTNPSFLTATANGIVYAVAETWQNPSVVTWQFNEQTFEFEQLASVSTHGNDPCHISQNGEVCAVGNYSGGSLCIFPLKNGIANEMSAQIMGSTGGPDTNRQSSPHVHCAIFSPDNKYIFASDFSSDRIIRYSIQNGDTTSFAVNSDYGPRHITFSPNGKQLYVLGELSGDITMFNYQNGNLVQQQVVKADKANARGAADIHISPDGQFLYASIRLKNDGIAIFQIEKNGSLREVGYTNTGIHPRNFVISPNGKFLLCACRDSNKIEVYSINKATGLLTKTPNEIVVDKSVCVEFL